MTWLHDPGREFAGYRIERLLGRGGMGAVYLAVQLSLGRNVALKVLAPVFDDPSFRERFINESRVAASIEHPNIIPIYDADEHDGLLMISMRYVEGSDLRAMLSERGTLPLPEALRIVEQVCGALDAAHASGLVHRDVKPANVLVAQRDGHVYLTDFGIAKLTSTRGITMTGSFVGTIDYSAPEQIEGKDVDGRADVYALGGVLYHCLTGQPPYPRDTDVAVMHAHLLEAPPAVSSLRSDLPRALDGVVVTAMAKYPDVRYQTCRELAEALRRVIEGEPVPLPAPHRPVTPSARPTLLRRAVSATRPAVRPANSRQRRRSSFFTKIAVAVALLGFGGGVAGALVLTRGGGERRSLSTSSVATVPPTTAPTTRSTTAPDVLERLPSTDLVNWPQQTLLRRLGKLDDAVVLGSTVKAAEGRVVAWTSLATERPFDEIRAAVQEQWILPLASAGYRLTVDEAPWRELQGPAIDDCGGVNVCRMWRRGRIRMHVAADGRFVESHDTAQIIWRRVTEAVARKRSLSTLRHPLDGTVKVRRPPYTEIEIAVSGPALEEEPVGEQDLALAPLLVNPRGDDDPSNEGRCFNKWNDRAELVFDGSTYRSDFIQCGDQGYGAGDPTRASGLFRFRAQRFEPIAQALSVTALAGIDAHSDSPGSVTWSLSYYGTPVCRRSLSGEGVAIELECRIDPGRGHVYEANPAALTIRQDVSLGGGGDFWAGLYRPRLTLRAP